MKNKFLGLTLTAVFSMSLVTGAYAGNHNDKKNNKMSYEQINKKDINSQVTASKAEQERMIMDSESNPYADINNYNSGSSLTFENNYDYYGVTSATGAALLDEQKRQEAIKQEEMQERLKDKQMINSNESTDFQSHNKSIYDSENTDMSKENTTTGSAVIIIDDISNINLLERYKSRYQDCADDLSRINGEIVKNDAFYACQRYKVN